MAGAWSADSCEGCSSTSCTCGHKGKWGDSSLLGKRLSEDSSRHQLLQKWASMWSSVSGDASVACPERTRREEAAEPAEEDRPLVFLCSRCRRPLGDSLSWTLYCAGCSLTLGYLYRCTPKDLDYKRDLFCLSVEAIESYVLGSSEKQIVSEDKELFNLESRVEIEKSLKQMEDVLKALQTKLWEVESKLSFTSCKS
ncbi:MIS18A [Cervus elaphus hippelaphus]|uniref:Protein Mis18-alpha n=1 Tax=Cervus elaphus hippelaphus TaxID=46360 RepID=A0A212C3M1_CEREH|nr:MIS18A [Cervus elaphus hippelaphus]